MTAPVEHRLARLDADLRGAGSLLVAFSGGADSAFLLAAAARALGPGRVVAATAVSPSLPAAELEPARRFAHLLGVRHETPPTHEMDRPGYRANNRDRCYHCKAELLDVLTPLMHRLGLHAVATGTNADDARDPHRPGIRAATERGARTPLRDAGLTKADIRAVSHTWHLPTAAKPAAACLSSRIVHGLTITPQRLATVEQAEAVVRDLLGDRGITGVNLRVRDLGDRARIDVDRIAVPVLLARLADLPALIGFPEVEVNPEGFRSGSLNDLPLYSSRRPDPGAQP